MPTRNNYSRPLEKKFIRQPQVKLPLDKSNTLKTMLEDLVGTRGAYILDEQLNILGKVPITELISTLDSLKSGVFAIVFDGIITSDIARIAEKINVKYIVGMDSKINNNSRVNILTQKQF